MLEYSQEIFNRDYMQAFARSSLMKRGITALKSAPVFKSLLASLPQILKKQHEYEKVLTTNGEQLLFSPLLKNLCALTILLDLNEAICFEAEPITDYDPKAIIPSWQWLQMLSLGINTADSIVKRELLPPEFLSFGEVNDELEPSPADNSAWSFKADAQIMSWVMQHPHDWQLGGKCQSYLWGSSRHGQLAEAGRNSLIPIFVESFSRAQTIVCGQNCTFVIQANGSVLACGEGSYGRLGQGNSDDLHNLSVISNLQGFVIIGLATSCGSDGHSMAIAESGEVFSWGDGDYGKLGHGNSDRQRRPRQIEILQGL